MDARDAKEKSKIYQYYTHNTYVYTQRTAVDLRYENIACTKLHIITVYNTEKAIEESIVSVWENFNAVFR